MTTNKLALAVRSAIGIGLLSALPTAPVFAQDEETYEEITVTGSRIVRDGFSSESPITVIGSEDIALGGNAAIDEFLKNVPQFTGYQMGTSTNNGSDSGQKKIDMRGLGFNRTLVLVNGRRTIGDTQGDGAVDLNTIPEAMVERVEVLTDGASTIYGSDALSGVVNFILRDEFEGVEVNANYGTGMEDGQAANNGYSILAGVSSDRGNMVFSASYANQDEMKQAERSWATEALYPQLNADGNFVAVGSGSSNSRKIRVPGNGNWILDGADVRPFSSGDTYNYAPVNALITPNERYQFAAIGKFEINEIAEAYFEGMYTRRTSQQRLAPDASFAVSSSVETPNNGLQWNDFVPANNPYNPMGVNCATSSPICNSDVRINRRFEESGGRLFRQTADQYRIVAGMRGEFDVWGGVGYDVSYTWAETETTDETKNYGRFDRWATAVDPVACAADPACAAAGVLNPFGEFGAITPEQMAYLSTGSLKDLFGGTLEMLSVNFNGNLMEMSGGTAGWAFGLETREETGYYSPDEFLSEGLTTGGAASPLAGSFEVGEVFGEVFLPVLDNLSVSSSVRWSDYNTSAGDTFNYKIGADWEMIEGLRARANYSTGFRAPNITELNNDGGGGFPVVESICEFGDRRLAAGDMTQQAWDNCQALGVNTTDAGELGFAWQSYYETSAPSTPLKAEESESVNIGLVYDVDFMGGLSLSADYYSVKIDNVIGSPDFNTMFQDCLNASDMLANASCQAFGLDASAPLNNHPAGPYPNWGGGTPYPGDAAAEFGNLGSLETNGVDFAASLSGDLEASFASDWTLDASATWMNKYEQTFQLGGTEDFVGTADGFAVFPEWRMNVGATLNGTNWSATYAMRYVGETTDRHRPASLTDDAVAEAMLYHDIVGVYNYNNIKVVAGINNLTDEDAPRFHSAFNANTEPGMYDVIGRRFFTSVTLSF